MQELYNEVVRQLNQLIRSCKDAMSLCQQWAYDGHKRYYQEYAIGYFEKLLYLKKKVWDMYRFMPLDDSMSVAYTPQSYVAHFPEWEKFLKSTIENLTDLNKKLFAETGIENHTLTEIIECDLYKDQERTLREIIHNKAHGNNPIALQDADRKLHKKEKKTMKKKGHK